jgi:hypothetical protein
MRFDYGETEHLKRKDKRLAKPVTDIENQVYHDFRTSIDDVITHLPFHTGDEAFALRNRRVRRRLERY